MATNEFQRIQKGLKMLQEATNPESSIQALTSLRRSILENQNIMNKIPQEELCELCSSVVNASITNNHKQHIEACGTLEHILTGTKDKNFDFFKSITQINRKKRLKILDALDILKSETVATVASKLSVIDFFNDCLISVQYQTMPWLLAENAENAAMLKNIENRNLNDEDFEEQVVDKAIKLLCKICDLSKFGLNIRLFDLLIMEKVIPLANMGHRKQRSPALKVLQKAIKNDLSLRVKSMHKDVWENYKTNLQNVYCKRMSILVNSGTLDWALLWETTINFIGTDLHRGSGLVNSLLKVEEHAFRSADPNRRQAFLSWKVLIENFALDQRELATNRRIKLLCTPLHAKNSKTESMVLTKLEVWWHLICKIYPSLSELVDSVLMPYLTTCFGPFNNNKPLFIQKTEANVSLGKKFVPTQLYAIDTFLQLIVSVEDGKELISSNVQKVSGPVGNSIFEKMYKVFIHCFGEIIVILSQLPEKDEHFRNKTKVCEVLWDSLIKRIEEYDRMKHSMYKEIAVVFSEIIRLHFHKIKLIKDFILHTVIKNFHKIANSIHFSENTLLEFVELFSHSDDFSQFNNHYQGFESLLWHTIKPKNSDVYYPETMKLLQSTLSFLNDAKSDSSNVSAVCEIWRVLARVSKKYIEESFNVNEGTGSTHNFKTIESILAFPFTVTFINQEDQLKILAETWKELYCQFDYQAELITTVKPNEILDKTSDMIRTCVKKTKCFDFVILCVDALSNTVNYEDLCTGTEESSPFVNLLMDLTCQSLKTKSCSSGKILKILSAFLLRLFNHSVEKTEVCLKNLQPIVYNMLKNDDNELESDISDTWKTIAGLFKKLQKYLNYDLLNQYRSTIVLAMMHLNKEVSSAAFSILDLKNDIDEKSKLVLDDIMKELEKNSAKSSFNVSDDKVKISKKKSTPVKPVGSFLNRKTMSPSNSTLILQNGKENIKKIAHFEPDSQDYVVIQSDVKFDVNRLTEHQKELLKKRRDDIPAMYNDLSISNSQDTQEIQQWFDARSGKTPIKSIHEPSNNNDVVKTSSPSFKNITQALTSKHQSTEDKLVITKSSKSSPKKSAATVAAAAAAEPSSTSSPAAAEKKPSTDAAAQQQQPVAKKLDFDSQEEFPPEESSVSPSIIDNGAKMRRKSTSGETPHSADVQSTKRMRHTRRSLQTGVPLRKSNSTDQLNNRRGTKRRNSETNSEGVLDIEREKRPKRETPESISEEDSEKTENSSSDGDGKKISKRQLNEMSRLKIDMVFKPLPSRRSVSKLAETPGVDKKSSDKTQSATSDKKPAVGYQSRISKVMNLVRADKKSSESKNNLDSKANSNKSERQPKDNKKTFSKGDNFEEDKSESSQSQQLISTRRRLIEVNTISTEDMTKLLGQEKESLKKVSYTKTLGGKSTARKSLTGKEPMVVFKKKIEVPAETQEEIDIEDVSTPADSLEKTPSKNSPVKSPTKISPSKSPPKSPLKTSSSESDVTSESEVKSSQESDIDIVESSQEPNLNSKMDKVEQCFIKIQKVEVAQAVRTEGKSEKDDKIIDASPAFTEDSSLSIIPATAEFDNKTGAEQPELKKVESNVTAKELISTNYMSSPKTSRLLKSRAFPISNRAAHMLGLVNQGSHTISQFTSSSSEKSSLIISNDDVTIVPISKKDKTDRISSPVSSSRQEKMFNNMNNAHIRPDRCSSPSTTMFCNLKNNGEKVSPKMDKVDKDVDEIEREIGDESLNFSARKELPMLEWSNANPPSLSASPSASILKRMPDFDQETPNRKKRVSFADPPVSREMGYEIMTENSSPPRLEKLPSPRSPTSRKDNRRQSRIRMIQMDPEKLEKENDVVPYNSLDIKESCESSSTIPITPKIKLATVLDEIPIEDKLVESKTTQSQIDSDMIVNCSVSSSQNTGKTQNDTIKLDTINLSKTDNNHASILEDTVDIANLTSLNSMSTFSGYKTGGSQPNSDIGDTLPVTDSVFSNPLSQETQTNEAKLIEAEKLDSALPIYPALIACSDAIDPICEDLVGPLFTNNLNQHFSLRSIRSVGDLAQMTERDINRLPIKSPKVDCIVKALTRYEERLAIKTPDRRPTPNVSSSTPLNKGRRGKVKSIDNTFEMDDLNVSEVCEYQKPSKRASTDNSMQTSPVKRSKREEEKACREMIDQCDDEFLFKTFVARFGADKILEGYKEKMKEKSEKELKKETLSRLGLSIEDDSEASLEASSKTAGLQKVLKQLPKIFDSDEEFYDNVLKTYKKNLKPLEVLKVLKLSEVEDAVTEVFDTSKMLKILNKKVSSNKDEQIHDSNELQVLLNHVSASSIIKQVKQRNELKTSEMFTIVSENFDALELSDMCNEAVKSGIRRLQK